MAGIIQGSAKDKSIHSQDYRRRIKEIFADCSPDSVVFDPFDGHEGSVHYDIEKGKSVFNGSLEKLRESDLMIAYLPDASLGTAIEMWESHKAGVPVWTITGMKDNWIVRFCSQKIFENIDALANHLKASTESSLKEK